MFGIETRGKSLTIRFGEETLQVPNKGYAGPCTKDLIWRSDLYSPVRFPTLRGVVKDIIGRGRRKLLIPRQLPSISLVIHPRAK